MKIAVLYEHCIGGHPFGASYIRTMLPLTHPSLEKHLQVAPATEFQLADILLIERTWSPYITMQRAEQVVRQARRAGMKVVYSLDDNLMDVNEFSPYEEVLTYEQLANVRYFASHADLVVVATGPLRERLLALNSNVVVIPNYLDERLFPAQLPAKPARDNIVLGYMGTSSHERDLLSIIEPLRTILHQYNGKVSLELVGVIEPERKQSIFGNLPVTVRRVPKDLEYPEFVAWMRKNLCWDIGLAPLEATPFTRCKSDIKWLDYSLLGIPGVFSRTAAYEESVVHDQTGLLAGDRAKDWLTNMRRLIDDCELRDRLRTNAFGVVREGRTLGHNAVKWSDALRQLMDRD